MYKILLPQIAQKNLCASQGEVSGNLLAKK